MTQEDLRYEIRAQLAARPTASYTRDEIRHRLSREGKGDATPDEIAGACLFLEGMNPPQVKSTMATLGNTTRWQITTPGILAHERNE